MEIKKNKITAILGIDSDLNIDEENLEKDFLKGITLINYLKDKFKDISIDKIQEALKICLLTDNDLNKPLNVLSSNEIEKLELTIKLLENREMIILSDFEINFLNKELNYFKLLFKKMTTKYNKTIVFITNKLDKIMDIIDFILIVEDKKVILELSSKDIYYDKIYDYTDMPEIIGFVKLARKNHAKLDDYIDIKELIKGIYRSV
jgi:ABC-type multidrug transport system ATPase subunit